MDVIPSPARPPRSRRFLTPDGLALAYRVWGPAGDRPVVVLHHGFAASAETNWVAPGIVDALLAAGRQVVAHDARGHGDSDKPHDPARYGEAVMARDMRRLFDVIGADEVDLVGYSMGAVVSLLAATFESRIRRLVVGGVGSGVVERGGVDTRSLDPRALADALLAEDPAGTADPVAAEFRAFADASGADRLALAAQALSAHAARIPLELITAPTLVLAGDRDPLAGHPEVLADAIGGSRLQLVPGDHLAAVVSPPFVAAVIEFLTG